MLERTDSVQNKRRPSKGTKNESKSTVTVGDWTELHHRMHCCLDEDGNAVSKPLYNIKSLLEWKPPSLKLNCLGRDRGGKQTLQHLRHSRPSADGPKVLVCHDMAGGYLNDRFVQGCPKKANAYTFYHWQLIDMFVYFSHHFITIPPQGWVLAAHKHGVDILGTVITEWEDGFSTCQAMLESADRVDEVTTKLAHIAAIFGFDGWLVNIENKIEPEKIPLLQSFVRQLTEKCHSCLERGTVLWYDSVITNGELKWQDELNSNNQIFFDVCDGIFLNYCITKEKLSRSRANASSCGRRHDVYVGIDVFGRGSPGGGGFNSREVLQMIVDEGLSSAIFAPGWVLEHLGEENFDENNDKFWALLSDLLGTRSISLPFSTTFCQGQGEKFYLCGQLEFQKSWFNLGLQSIQPCFSQSQFLSHTIVKEVKAAPATPERCESTEDAKFAESSIEENSVSEMFVQTEDAGSICDPDGHKSSVEVKSKMPVREKATVEAIAEATVAGTVDQSDKNRAGTLKRNDCQSEGEAACPAAKMKEETNVSVVTELRQMVSRPRMSVDQTCAYSGGGCLRLEAQALPGLPVVFKLFNICNISELRQLSITWRTEANSVCHFAFILSPVSCDAVIENAAVVFESCLSPSSLKQLRHRISKPAVSIPVNPGNLTVSSSWTTRTHNINLEDLENGNIDLTEDMTLSAVLLPIDMVELEKTDGPGAVVGQTICLWLGQLQASTHPATPVVSTISNLRCLEVTAGSTLSSSDLEEIDKRVCPKASPQEEKSVLQPTSVASEACATLPVRMATLYQLDLLSSKATQDDQVLKLYLLSWDAPTCGIVEFSLVYMVKEDFSKVFLGFSCSDSFVYRADEKIVNGSFLILPVLSL